MSPAISSLTTRWHRVFFTQCRGMQKDECDGETIGDFLQKLWYRISMDMGSNFFPKDAWEKWLLSSGEIAQTPQSPTSVNMKDQRVEQVPHFKYLRTKVDNPLTFQDNVNYIYTKRHSAYNNMMPASPWSTKCPNL